ncbi:MAG: hypothetical protein ACXVEE_14480 [Polyangiales bacterium]
MCSVVVACARPQPVDVVAPDPSTKPLPTTPEPPPPMRACEPIVRCGVWSGCVWLERIDDLRYRAIGGSEKGSVFVRRHECWPADASTSSCAVYCTGVDGGAPCVDGLHPEQEECTGAAVPTPNSTRCLMGAGICGSFI